MGNTALLPEKAWGGDIGFESDYKNKLINRITLFGSIISDMIAWDEVDPDENYDKWRPSNIGNAYNLGIEAEIIHKISKYFTQKIDYTYLDSKGKTDISSTYKTLMYTPEHRINYRFNYKSCRGLGLTFTVSSTDRIRWEDGYGLIHILPRYTLLNAVINKEIKGFNVFLSINNILAEKYQSREDYPLPGRNSSGGIKIVF
jgi:outer membrane receptor protein involved in Fe transport